MCLRNNVCFHQTTAKRDGDDLIINGEKVWISSGLQADWMCLLANTSQGNAYKNKSLIVLPMNLKGLFTFYGYLIYNTVVVNNN